MDLNYSLINKEGNISFIQSNKDILKNCDITSACLKDLYLEADVAYFRFIMLGIILAVVEIFGIIGNVLSMIVLSRSQMKSSTNYLLLGLAVFDTIVIINSTVILTLASIFPYTEFFIKFNLRFLPYYSLLFQPLMAATYMISVYLILAVTIERYVAVCHPLKAKTFCTTATSKKCIYTITIIGILYHLPMYFETTIVVDKQNKCQFIVKCVTETAMGRESLFVVIYWEYMHSIFISFLPLSLLAYFNTCIFREVKRANKNREQMTASQENDIDLATMLLRVVLVFFVCNIVFPILHLSRYCVKDNSLIMWPIMKDVGQFLVVTNSCSNFYLYVASGTKFKQVFVQIFRNRIRLGNNKVSDAGQTKTSIT